MKLVFLNCHIIDLSQQNCFFVLRVLWKLNFISRVLAQFLFESCLYRLFVSFGVASLAAVIPVWHSSYLRVTHEVPP